LRAVTPDELASVIAVQRDGPIHIHAAEQTREVEACMAWSARRPVEWLLENASVDDRWCLIHATHMTEKEAKALAVSGATAGLCPVTEANLGDGIFPGRLYLDRGGAFGIGTDSNVLVDAASELRQLEYAQRLGDRARNRLSVEGKSTGRTLFDGALAGGNKALGIRTPGLVSGASADVVSLRSEHALRGRNGDRILDAWIFASRDPAVDCVWVRGEKLVTDGRHRAGEAIRKRFDQAIAALLD
jgi:formiminoglutamate deiminase